MAISVKRAYEQPAPEDGYRILVDRLWPRGLTRDRLAIDEWLKDTAPSDRLRKAYHNGETTWAEFRKDYLAALTRQRNELRRLVPIAQNGKLTLVFSAQDKARNNAVVLMQYLKMLGAN